MQPQDNLDPLKYESDTRAVPNTPVFSVPPDMKYDPILARPIASVSVQPPIPHLEKKFLLAVGIFFVLAIFAMFLTALWPPSDFPTGTTFHIEGNSSLGQIADNLYADHSIKSETLLKAFVIIFSGEKGIKAGNYLFDSRQSVAEIAWRLVHGEQGFTPIKVTIPEGFDIRQISVVLGKDIPTFSTSTFMASAMPFEGYLFPDTYFFNQQTTPNDVIQTMRSLFDQKILTVQGLPLYESSSTRAEPGTILLNRPGTNLLIRLVQTMTTSSIIIMASILEREATSSVDRRIIAGILWKRLDNKMPLQVDAALAYILNKDGTKLTSADLATTSPFNTYKNLGLPPTPIGNPGLSAIIDAITPTTTPFWYYLSDSKGNIHYSKSYDEQMANEVKYL
jgi:UPF0755 protein